MLRKRQICVDVTLLTESPASRTVGARWSFPLIVIIEDFAGENPSLFRAPHAATKSSVILAAASIPARDWDSIRMVTSSA